MIGCKSSDSSKTDPNAVKDVFKRYQTAITNNDGEAAVKLLDQRTVNWYSQSLKDAIEIPRDELERLIFLRKLMVLKLRHHYSLDQLKSFDGKAIIIDAVEKGWMNKAVVSDLKITKVTFEDHAAQAYVSSVKSTPMFHFRYQHNEWKLALWKLLYVTNKHLEEIVKESGMSEEEYILLSLEAEAGFKVDATILNGPRI